MQDYIEELHEDSERIIKRVNSYLHDLVLLGQEIERIDMMEVMRDMITEKDVLGDQIAVDVLTWAYERLAETKID